MKYLLATAAVAAVLTMAGCGMAADPESMPAVDPPTVEPLKGDDPIIGRWLCVSETAEGNQVADCSVLGGGQVVEFGPDGQGKNLVVYERES